ncbi:hypothetical protein BASA81_007556 [Batrachochytrium salamandrivorans]|nr:hypothetical protein BASA81_007556 [Batrachochytrium salamandrivorans]
MRFLLHIARGLVSGPGKTDNVLAHTYRSRAGLFDIDVNLHLNNASLILQTEFARWNWMAQNGLLVHAVKNRWVFLAASQAVRYRHEVFAFHRMEIKTTIAAVDEDWIWVRHCVWSRQKLCAQSLLRVKIKQGRRTVSPTEFFSAAKQDMGIDLQELNPNNSKEIQAYLLWDAECALDMKRQQ